MTATQDVTAPTPSISTAEIYEAPTFQEVRAASSENGAKSHRTLKLKIASLHAGSPTGDPAAMSATCKLGELVLQNISHIKYDSEEREFSFHGESVCYYEHTSYNQSSTRTERTKYKVVVRWKFSEENARAYLILIW